jgi:hypothetical protein
MLILRGKGVRKRGRREDIFPLSTSRQHCPVLLMQPDYTVLNIMDQAADSEVQQMNMKQC